MGPRSAFVAIAVLSFFTGSVLPQEGDAAAKKAALQEKVAALKESVARNQAALKQFRWTETTEVSLKGEVKKTEQKDCLYGPDGKVQKTPVAGSDQPAEKPAQSGGRRGRRGGGAVKEKVVAKKTDELKDYMGQVGALVKLYVPPAQDKIQSAVKAGKVAVDRSTEEGFTALSFSDYAKSGDRLELTFDSAAGKLLTYSVNSYLEKPDDIVTLSVSFDSLPDGTNYANEIVLDGKSKKILVNITNSGHQKLQ